MEPVQGLRKKVYLIGLIKWYDFINSVSNKIEESILKSLDLLTDKKRVPV